MSDPKKLHLHAISETIDLETWLWRRKMFRIKKQLIFLSTSKNVWVIQKFYFTLLSRKLSIFEHWQGNKNCLEPKNNFWKKVNLNIGDMSHQEKATSSWFPETIDFWDSIMKTKLFRIKKQLRKRSTFIIRCRSQPEKATSSCYLVNYRLLRPDYEDRSCW